MFLKQFEIIKKYIIENLVKGFIKSSQILFIISILFVRKANKSFKFYIDFKLLNSLIKKNWYLLLLVNKTFTQLTNIKIYTKLNIQQIFYCIKINPASKKYTTFYTKYNFYKYKVISFKLINRFIIY